MPSKKQLTLESAKSQVASYTNSSLVMLYWYIGSLINQEILNNKRAEYGEQILSQIAKRLTILYGNGFDFANLSRMVKFSKLYPSQQNEIKKKFLCRDMPFRTLECKSFTT